MNRIIYKSALAFTTIALLMLSNVSQARPDSTSCPVGNTISKTFSSGAAWDMCWEVRDQEGVVLSDIHYKPVGRVRRRVMGEASLSQIQTEYDDGSASQFLVTDFGLGGNNLQTLTTEICEGGQLHKNDSRDVLCEISKAAGYIYRYKNNERRQGSKLDLFSASNIDSREFIVHWGFMENGTIETAVGQTGQLTKFTNDASAGWSVTSQNKLAASFVNHYFWRLDFDLASDNSNDIVEQIKSIPSTNRLTKTKQTQTVSTESAASFAPNEKKFFRVRDESVRNNANQSISYEMVMLNYAQQNKGNDASSWLKNDIFITRYNACERFAVKNPTNNCGENVAEFVNGQNTNAKDIVVWYRQAQQTLPRDEDFSLAATQWSSFTLLPRDWTSTNRL